MLTNLQKKAEKKKRYLTKKNIKIKIIGFSVGNSIGVTPLVHWHKLSINTASKYSVQKSQLPKGKPIGYRQSAAKDFNPELSALNTQPLSEVLKVGDF